jgi:radical SAM superfamily enzyme YgiQ (UPF0313 family)
MYIQRARTFELARELRRSGRRVLLGGSIVNALPDACAREADVVFHGESELTWPRFVDDLEKGRIEASYVAPERFDLARSKMPRFDLLKMRLYSTGSIQTSRGCPYACDYCDVPLLDGKPRTKTVEQVMAEVELHHRLGIRSIFFVDDHLLGSRKFALALFAELERFVERTGRKTIFYCQATVNLAKDDEALRAMYRANFRRVFLGIESDDVEALRAANKAHNVAMPLLDAVRTIQKHDITVWAALLGGFDRDGADVFERYRRFAQEACIAMVIPGLLQAVPGTAYADRIRREGRLVPLRNGYVAGQAGSLDTLEVTNVAQKRMTKDELVAGFRGLARALYAPDAYADRLIGMLEAGELPELGKADLADVWAARGILRRAVRHFLIDGDAGRRRLFLRVMGHLAKNGFRRVDEAIFHLVIWKHLHEFYAQAADHRVPTADDVLPASGAA